MELEELVASIKGHPDLTTRFISAGDIRSISDAYKAMEVALRLADDWLACVEPHLRDSDAFKRDYGVIRAALEDSHYEG